MAVLVVKGLVSAILWLFVPERNQEIRKIGNGSAVTIRVREQLDGRYKSKKFQSAYLKAINVRELVEAEPYMDFDEDDN